MVASKELIEKIDKVLRPHFPNDTVDVSPSNIRDNIHVVVVSRKFDEHTEQEKQELLWGLIDAPESGLTEEEKLQITLMLPTSPAELK